MFHVKNRFENLRRATEGRSTRKRRRSSTPNPDLPLLHRSRRRSGAQESTVDLWVMAFFIAALVGGIIAQY